MQCDCRGILRNISRQKYIGKFIESEKHCEIISRQIYIKVLKLQQNHQQYIETEIYGEIY